MRKVLCVMLMLMLLCCFTVGCDIVSGQADDIVGRWETLNHYTGDSVKASLEELDFYDEEIALLDTDGITFVDVMEFREDKTYVITCDAEQSMAMVKQYFRDAIATFYLHRDELDPLYDQDLTAMSETEFQQFYVELYSQERYDALIDVLAYSITNEEYLVQDTETGTYRLTAGKVWCKTDGSDQEEYIRYSVEGDVLELIYLNDTVEYTRSEP